MLIFDSGVGGFSILKKIKKILPHIHYIYVLDNQFFPYGDKKNIFILERSIKIIKKIKEIYPISMVIIACNTVSTISLSVLRKKFNFPIIGIFPQIADAEKITKNKIIGLIATQATINSIYIKKIICKKSSGNTIKIIATNKLATIAENKIRGLNISKKEIQNIFQPWTNLTVQPDTIILGCTHFILLKKEIQKILYNSIYFIDSTEKIISYLTKNFNKLKNNQKIKKNIFLYSKNHIELKQLLFFLKRYNFKKIQHINLN